MRPSPRAALAAAAPFAAALLLAALPLPAAAQDDGVAEVASPEADVPTVDVPDRDVPDAPALSEAQLDRLAEKLADKLADRVAAQVADRLEAKLADLTAAPAGPDAELRAEIAGLVKQIPDEDLRGAVAEFIAERWPAGEPAAERLVPLAQGVYVLGLQLRASDAAYDAFALAGELARDAVEAGEAPAGAGPLGSVFYNSACALALAGEPETAAEHLALAFEYGWDDIQQLKDDPDLKTVRELPAFGEKLAAWEQAAREAALAEARRLLEEGESFPLKFTYNDTTGREQTLDQYAGQVVIVDFWGTWCPPCRKEIPSFVKLQDEYREAGLQILGLNYGDEQEEVEAFAEKFNMNYPTGVGPEEARDMVPDFSGYPTTVFVGRDGTVRMTAVGLHDYAFLEAVATTLLAEEAPEPPAAPTEPADDEPAADDAEETATGAAADAVEANADDAAS